MAINTDTIVIDANKTVQINYSGDTIQNKLGKIIIGSDGKTVIDNLKIDNINDVIASTGKISGAKIADNAINYDHIVTGAILNSKIAKDAVTEEKIKDGEVTTSKIRANNITDALIQEGGLNSGSIKDRAITAAKISLACITKDHIAEKTITQLQLADNSIITRHITNGNITDDKIANNISGTKISDKTISNDKLTTEGKVTFTVNGTDHTIALGGKLDYSLSTATNIRNGYSTNSIYQTSAYVPIESATGAVVFGNATQASAESSYQAVFGQYNADNKNALLIVGNGGSTTRKNIFEVYDDGTAAGYSGIKLYDKTNDTMLGIHLNDGELYFNDNPVVTIQHNRLAVPAITNFSTKNGIIAACDEINVENGAVDLQKAYSMLDKSSLTIKGSTASNLQAQIMLADTNGSSATIKATTTKSTAKPVFTLPEAGGTIITDAALKLNFNGYRYSYALTGTVLTISRADLQ